MRAHALRSAEGIARIDIAPKLFGCHRRRVEPAQLVDRGVTLTCCIADVNACLRRRSVNSGIGSFVRLELFVEPGLDAAAAEFGDQRGGRPERQLVEDDDLACNRPALSRRDAARICCSALAACVDIPASLMVSPPQDSGCSGRGVQ